MVVLETMPWSHQTMKESSEISMPNIMAIRTVVAQIHAVVEKNAGSDIHITVY